MKSSKNSRELTFTAARKTEKVVENMGNGMLLKPESKRTKCNANKRSSVQGFTFG